MYLDLEMPTKTNKVSTGVNSRETVQTSIGRIRFQDSGKFVPISHLCQYFQQGLAKEEGSGRMDLKKEEGEDLRNLGFVQQSTLGPAINVQ